MIYKNTQSSGGHLVKPHDKKSAIKKSLAKYIDSREKEFWIIYI